LFSTKEQQLAALGSTLLSTAAERDQANLDKLKKIKGNIEELALKDMEKLQKIMAKEENRER
jgi:hypothetical protein